MTIIVIWGILAVAAAIVAAIVAPMKNRDWSVWAAWCFLVPPLVVVLILTPRSATPPRTRPTLDQLDRHDDRMM